MRKSTEKSLLSLLGLVGLVEYPEHLLLDGFLLQSKAVLVPNEVRSLGADAVALHASFEQIDDVRVVGVLGETQPAAVVHEFLELLGLVAAEFLDAHLLLLLLNVGVLLLLRPARKALPGQLSLQEVEQHVSNSL
jgi:hypothetical protein